MNVLVCAPVLNYGCSQKRLRASHLYSVKGRSKLFEAYFNVVVSRYMYLLMHTWCIRLVNKQKMDDVIVKPYL